MSFARLVRSFGYARCAMPDWRLRLTTQVIAMKILLNHVGYTPSARKVALIEAPAAAPLTGFTVYDAETRAAVHTGALVATGGVDQWKDWHFWQADFSALATPGEYFIVVDGPQPALTSHTFAVGADLFAGQMLSDLVHYIKGQRCTGLYDHADRSRPKFGSDERRDVHGGWFDASGDCSKYLSHLSVANFMNPQQTPQVVWNLLDGWAQLPPQLKWFNERMVDEALHGADFFAAHARPGRLLLHDAV